MKKVHDIIRLIELTDLSAVDCLDIARAAITVGQRKEIFLEVDAVMKWIETQKKECVCPPNP